MVAATSTERSLRRHFVGIMGTIGLAVLTGAWAASIDLSGAIVATGSLVVESNAKKVQHPTGGVVSELTVQEGSRVDAGDLLIRLDDTTARANLAAVTKGLWEFTARRARLEAERDDLEALHAPDDLRAAAGDPEIARIVTGEATFFRLRREALQGQEAQLRERVGQLGQEIKGLVEQIAAKEEELEVAEREYAGVLDLWRKSLIQITRLTALERERARLKGERGQLVASAAQARGKISETELQILQLRQNLRSEVAKELAEIRAKIATLAEQKVTALDQIRRIDIRAPQTGYVHELAVHTVGGVVTAGEQMMLIVPTADMLMVEVRVTPQDINQVYVGQVAKIRLPSLDPRTTPELNATVSRVAADVTEDQRSGAGYFSVRLALSREETERLGRERLLPGMPVNAFIRTADRTLLCYLVKPLSEQAQRAFRER